VLELFSNQNGISTGSKCNNSQCNNSKCNEAKLDAIAVMFLFMGTGLHSFGVGVFSATVISEQWFNYQHALLMKIVHNVDVSPATLPGLTLHVPASVNTHGLE